MIRDALPSHLDWLVELTWWQAPLAVSSLVRGLRNIARLMSERVSWFSCSRRRRLPDAVCKNAHILRYAAINFLDAISFWSDYVAAFRSGFCENHFRLQLVILNLKFPVRHSVQVLGIVSCKWIVHESISAATVCGRQHTVFTQFFSIWFLHIFRVLSCIENKCTKQMWPQHTYAISLLSKYTLIRPLFSFNINVLYTHRNAVHSAPSTRLQHLQTSRWNNIIWQMPATNKLKL